MWGHAMQWHRAWVHSLKMFFLSGKSFASAGSCSSRPFLWRGPTSPIPSFWSLWVSGPVVLQRPLGGRHHMDGDLNYAVTSKGQMLHGVHRLVFADAENGALLRGRKTR